MPTQNRRQSRGIAFFAPGIVEKSPEMAENAGKIVFQAYLDTGAIFFWLKFGTHMQNSDR